MSNEIERSQPKRPLDETDDWWIQGGVVSGLSTAGLGGAGILLQFLTFLPFLGTLSAIAFGGAGLALLSTLLFVVTGTLSHKKKSRKELE